MSFSVKGGGGFHIVIFILLASEPANNMHLHFYHQAFCKPNIGYTL
jgi:hypothetical protein